MAQDNGDVISTIVMAYKRETKKREMKEQSNRVKVEKGIYKKRNVS